MSKPVRNDQGVPEKNWFTTTHWSVVLAAKDPNSEVARAALEKLCQSSWAPLYAFLRSQGNSPEDAMDVTQGFLAELIHKRRLEKAEQHKGRFRSFLLASIKHYARDEWVKGKAFKRGGQVQFV